MGESELERLEQLVLRERTLVKAELVRAVVVQPMPFDEKIRRIEMIDLMPEEAPPVVAAKPRAKAPLARPAKDAPAPAPAPPPPTPRELGAEERAKVEGKRRQLVPRPHRSHWWDWATEYVALVRAGAQAGTLERAWLPFSVRLSGDTRVYLSRTLPEAVLPVLAQALPPLLAKSWAFLSKTEYNLLAALHTLVATCQRLRAPQQRRQDKAWWGLLDPVLPTLLLFRTSDGLVARVQAAWSQACRKLSVPEATRSNGIDSIRSLLESRSDRVALPDAAVALLSLRSRHLVDLAELVEEPGPDYFARDTFDAPAEALAEISRVLGQLTSRFEALEKSAADVARARYFLPEGDLLEAFCPHGDLEPPAWTVALLDRVDSAMAPLLVGTVKFSDLSTGSVLASEALAATLERLGTLKNVLLDPVQGRNPSLLLDAGRVLTGLGKQLVVLIRNRSRHADALVRAADPASLTDPLPRETDVLEAPPAWAGLTVIEALVLIARLCLQGGQALGDTSLDATLEQGAQVRTQARELLARYRHLAHPQDTAACRERFAALLEGEAP